MDFSNFDFQDVVSQLGQADLVCLNSNCQLSRYFGFAQRKQYENSYGLVTSLSQLFTFLKRNQTYQEMLNQQQAFENLRNDLLKKRNKLIIWFNRETSEGMRLAEAIEAELEKLNNVRNHYNEFFRLLDELKDHHFWNKTQFNQFLTQCSLVVTIIESNNVEELTVIKFDANSVNYDSLPQQLFDGLLNHVSKFFDSVQAKLKQEKQQIPRPQKLQSQPIQQQISPPISQVQPVIRSALENLESNPFDGDPNELIQDEALPGRFAKKLAYKSLNISENGTQVDGCPGGHKLALINKNLKNNASQVIFTYYGGVLFHGEGENKFGVLTLEKIDKDTKFELKHHQNEFFGVDDQNHTFTGLTSEENQLKTCKKYKMHYNGGTLFVEMLDEEIPEEERKSVIVNVAENEEVYFVFVLNATSKVKIVSVS